MAENQRLSGFSGNRSTRRAVRASNLHGDVALDDRIELVYDPARYDSSTRTLALPIRLRNSSNAAIYPPIAVEVEKPRCDYQRGGLARARRGSAEAAGHADQKRGGRSLVIARKLHLKRGMRVAIINAPAGFSLGRPAGVTIENMLTRDLDLVM